jgi:hypothetical protein
VSASGSSALAQLEETYALRPSFAKHVAPHLYVRAGAGDGGGALSYVAPTLARYAHLAPGASPAEDQAAEARRPRQVATGIRLMERRGRQGNLRLTQAGARLLRPFATKQVVMLGLRAFRRLLYNVGHSVTLSQLGESAQKAAAGLQAGSVIIVLKRSALNDEATGTEKTSAATPAEVRSLIKACVKQKKVATGGDAALYHALFCASSAEVLLPGQYCSQKESLKLTVSYSKVRGAC